MHAARLVAAAMMVVGVAGCSSHASSGEPVVTTPPATVSTSAVTTPAAPTPSSPPATPTVSAATPAASSTAVPPSSSSTALLTACTASQLSISLVKGGASLGQEIAIVTFTNSSATACTVQGYPSAQLEDVHGTSIGRPATHVTGSTAAVVLAPKHAAQATLTAGTRCNAPESSAVRLELPTAPGATDIPVALRACTLQVTPVARS